MKQEFFKAVIIMLCSILLIGTLAVCALADQTPPTTVVYLDGTLGSDTNDGSAADKAVGSLQKAYEILFQTQNGVKDNSAADGIIVVCGATLQSSDFANTQDTALEHKGTVTFTSYYNGVDYATQNNANITFAAQSSSELRIQMGGPTVYSKVTVSANGTKAAVTIYTSTSLIIEQDSYIDANLSSKKIYIRGGYAYKTTTLDTDIVINTGTFSFVAPSNAEAASSGNFNVTVGGDASVSRLVGGQTNSVGGTTDTSTVTVNSSATVTDLYVCGDTGVITDATVIINGGNVGKISSRRSGKSGTAVNFTLILKGNCLIPENTIAAISGKNFTGTRSLVISGSNDTAVCVDSIWNTLTVTDQSDIVMATAIYADTALIVDSGSRVTLAQADNHPYSGDGEVIYVHEHNWVIDTQNSIEPDCTTKGVTVYMCDIGLCVSTKTEQLGYKHSFENGACATCGGRYDTVFVSTGSDGDGYTQSTAVNSLEEAYALLLERTDIATDANSLSTIVICGTLKIDQHFNYYGDITHKGTVIITGEDYDGVLNIWAESKSSLTPTDEHRIQLGGPTVIKNLTIDRGGDSVAVSLTIYAANNLTVEESVNIINTNWSSTYIESMSALSDEQISSIMLSAHRGYQPSGPENSILSYTAAGQLGFEYIECDVYQTLDGELVTIHDSTLDRTTSGSGNVTDMTYSQILEYRIDTAAHGFDISTANPDDLYVPTFREYLQICKQYGCKPFIEIKDSREQTIKKIIDMALEYFESDEIVMSCTNLSALKTSYAYNNDIFHHLIWGDTSFDGYTNSISVLSQMVNSAGQVNAGIAFNIQNLHIESNFNTAKVWIEKAHAQGLKACLRGADDIIQLRKMFELNIDYYPTNTTSPQDLSALKNAFNGGYTYSSASGGKVFVRGGTRYGDTANNINITLLGGMYDFVAPSNDTANTTGNYSITLGENVFVSRLVAGETATAATDDRAESTVTINNNATVKNLYLAGDTANTLSVTVDILGGTVESMQENRSKSGTAVDVTVSIASPELLPDTVSISDNTLLTGTKTLILNGIGEIYNCDMWDKLIANDGAVITLLGAYPDTLECVESGKFIFANQTPTDDFTYEITDSKATVTGYTGTDTQVLIPAEIEGYPVTDIGTKAFYLNRTLTSVTIPSSVKTIGANAFRGCTALTDVIFNEGLESIGTYAFGGTKLVSIVFPSTLKVIGVSAFNGVTTLESIDLANVQEIKGTAFANCTSLGGLSAANRIIIPKTVTSLGAGAFNNCTSIVRVDWYPAKLTSGAAGNITTPAFMGCSGIKTVNIFETVESIPSYLFYKAADPSAKQGITTLSFEGTPKVKSIGDYAFYQARMGTVTLPDSLEKIGKESFRNCNLLITINFGSGVASIGQQAFSNCNSLESVTIPGNIKTVYAYAFRNCSKLETVVFEEGVEYISSYVFMGTSLKSLTLANSITKINSGIAYQCEDAVIYYYQGSYAEKYLNSSAAKITGQTLSSLGEYVPQ